MRDLERGERGARDQSELHMGIIIREREILEEEEKERRCLNTSYLLVSEVEINLDE